MKSSKSKLKQSQRPYRRSTASIGDILLAKAASGNMEAQYAASVMLHNKKNKRY